MQTTKKHVKLPSMDRANAYTGVLAIPRIIRRPRGPEFCLKLAYRYLWKAGHVAGDPGGGAIFGPRGII